MGSSLSQTTWVVPTTWQPSFEEDGPLAVIVLHELGGEAVLHHLLALVGRFGRVERRDAPYVVEMGGLDDVDVRNLRHPARFLAPPGGHVRVKVPAPVSSRFSRTTLEALPSAPIVKVTALATPPFSPGGT